LTLSEVAMTQQTNYIYDDRFASTNHSLKLSNARANYVTSAGRQNIYDPLFDRYQKEHMREERLKSVSWDTSAPSERLLKSTPMYAPAPTRSQSDSKVVTSRSLTNTTKKTPKRYLSLFGKKTKKNLPNPNQNSNRMEDSDRLVHGVYPPDFEAQVIRKMKVIAANKAKQGLWEESYFTLRNVLRCEQASLGNEHPQVANTLYHMGVALYFLGDTVGALAALEDGIQILFPMRYREKNVDLAALFYQCGLIKGENNDDPAALYYLDLAKQVEIYIFGNVTEKTIRSISDYEYAKKASRRLNQIRTRAA
jgi:hypothetical protein